MARGNKVKIDVELNSNIPNQLGEIEKAINKVKKFGDEQIKLRIDNTDLKNIISDLRKLESGLDLKLKLDVEDIKNQLKDVKIKVDIEDIDKLERLSSGSIRLDIDFSPISQLENRLNSLFSNLGNSNSLSEAAGNGGLNSMAVAGGMALANRYSNTGGGSGGSGGVPSGLGRAGMIGGTVVALGGAIASGADLNNLYKQILQSVGNDVNLTDKIYNSALSSFNSGTVKDMNGLGYVSSTLGRLDNVSDLSSKELTDLINTSYLWEQNHGVDVDELFITLNSLMSKEGKSKNRGIGFYTDLLNVGLSSGANQLNKDFLPSMYEFISQADMSGLDSVDMVNTYMNNVAKGGWNQDGIGNSWIEFNTKMSELSTMSNDEDAMDVRDALTDINVDWNKVRTGFKAGGEEGKEALLLVLKGLKNVDEATRRVAGTKLFGTANEDHMDALIDSMIMAQEVALDFDGSNVANLASETENVYTQIEGIKNSVKVIAGSTGEIIASLGSPAITLLAETLSFAADKLVTVSGFISEVHDKTSGMSSPLGLLKSTFEAIGDIVEGIDDDTSLWESTWTVLKDRAVVIRDTVKELWGYVQKIGGSFLGGVGDLVSNPLDFIKENDFTRKIFSIDGAKPSESVSSGGHYGGALQSLTLRNELKIPRNGLYNNMTSFNKLNNSMTGR